MAPDARKLDVVLVGGGLANSLAALRLASLHPQLRTLILERDDSPPLGQTWCLFQSDVAPQTWAWLSRAFAHLWPGYEVVFPAHRRRLATPYACITGESLRAAMEEAGVAVRRGVEAASIGPESVELATGEVLQAPLVIDGRGARPSSQLDLAWQKFVGLVVELKRPHGLSEPIVMDATVRQSDGYRFLYTLPFGKDRLLVEDTRYSDGAELDVAALETEVLRYVRGRGWSVARVVQRERGVLPVALGGDIAAFWAEADPQVPQLGMRSALFHPTTGYSLPEAARSAELIAGASRLDSRTVAALVRERSLQLWRRRGFYRALNRMLFLAADPGDRYRVLERFYRLPQPLVERFYAARLTMGDKLRILTGRPPVSMRRAMAALVTRRRS